MQRGGAAECEARPSRRASSAALQGPASLRNVKLPLRRAVHAELRASQAGRGTAGRAPAASRTRQCSCPRPSRRPSRRDRSRRRRRRRSARPTLPRLARHRLARGPHRSAAPQRRAAAPIRSAAMPRRRASRVASRPPSAATSLRHGAPRGRSRTRSARARSALSGVDCARRHLTCRRTARAGAASVAASRRGGTG